MSKDICHIDSACEIETCFPKKRQYTNSNDDRLMIACCNDGTRPVIFKIERIDIPESDEETEWLAKQNYKNTAEDAYTG